MSYHCSSPVIGGATLTILTTIHSYRTTTAHSAAVVKTTEPLTLTTMVTPALLLATPESVLDHAVQVNTAGSHDDFRRELGLPPGGSVSD